MSIPVIASALACDTIWLGRDTPHVSGVLCVNKNIEVGYWPMSFEPEFFMARFSNNNYCRGSLTAECS